MSSYQNKKKYHYNINTKCYGDSDRLENIENNLDIETVKKDKVQCLSCFALILKLLQVLLSDYFLSKSINACFIITYFPKEFFNTIFKRVDTSSRFKVIKKIIPIRGTLF